MKKQIPISLNPRLPSEVRDLVQLLSIKGAMPQEIPPEIVAHARTAGVLEALAIRPGVRAAIGEAADYFIAQVAMGAMRLHEFREIATAMDKNRIPLVPLKGMAYALMFEKGGPTRAMADIDLLVPPDQFEAACAVMRDLGYEEKPLGPIEQYPGHHELGFRRNGRLVEIHPRFLRERRVTVDYAALWARTVPLDRNDVVCRRLSREDTFLYHCLHMGMHEFATHGLLPVWELRKLVLDDAPDLVMASRRAREWNTIRFTWCALRLLEECFPGTLSAAPNSDSQAIRLFQPRFLSRLLLEKFIVEPSLGLLVRPKLLPRPVQIFRKGLLVDRVSGVASYLWWYSKAFVASRRRG